MAVLPTVKRLPDWNNHPSVFAAWCQCLCLGFKAFCKGKPAATPCKLFFSPSFQPLCDLWSVLVRLTGSHPSSPPYPTTLPIPVILPQISMQNSDLLLPKTGSRDPSLQHFLKTKFYGLKRKHSQVPYQFSALLTGHLKPNSASTKLMWEHYNSAR